MFSGGEGDSATLIHLYPHLFFKWHYFNVLICKMFTSIQI